MILTIKLNLDGFPAGRTDPDEVATVLREVADWIEKKHGDYEQTGPKGKTLRNFESTAVGFLTITTA